jgi:hypothetical protein
MFATYTPGSLTLRDLAPDDVAGVCAIYPSSRTGLPACDASPRHGYSTECSQPVTEASSGCSVAAVPGTLGGLGALGGLSAVVLVLRRRRRG